MHQTLGTYLYRMMQRWLFVLSLLVPVTIMAAVVPSPDPLEADAASLFNLLQEADRKDSRTALKLSFSLQSMKLTSTENRVWSKLLYCYYLLENDSISKSLSILTNSKEIRWNDLVGQTKAFHLFSLGYANTYLGNYTKADSLFESSANENQNEILSVKLKQATADNLRYQGRLDESMVSWLAALELSEKQKDSVAITDCFIGIGIVEFLRAELENATKHVNLYWQFNSRIGNQKKVAYGLSILSLIDYQNDEYESSIEKSLRSYEIRKQTSDLKGQGESLNNLALGYMGLKNWPQALRYLNDAILVKTQANDFTQMTVILNNIGHCYRQLGDTEKAVEYFERALQKGRENGQLEDMMRSYRNLVAINAENGNYQRAYELQSLLIQLRDSIADMEQKAAVRELEVKLQADRKQREIELLQKERSIITNRWLTVALGLFFALIFGILIYDGQKRKHRQEKELLAAEDELQKAELKIMTDLLEHNQQKLSLYTENLLRKNELVGKLESKLKETIDGQGHDEGENETLLSNIASVRILTDDDWEEFKTLFDGVHTGLLDKLLSDYRDLTLGEQRLFLLMKLSMSTREIANILGVSPDSVKKGRYRLKKKLGLPETNSLQEFIDDF